MPPGSLSPKKPKSAQLPGVDAHSGFSGFRINVASGESANYFIASVTENHGPHDAIAWTTRGECILVQASSMWGFSINQFALLLTQLQNEKIKLIEIGCLGR